VGKCKAGYASYSATRRVLTPRYPSLMSGRLRLASDLKIAVVLGNDTEFVLLNPESGDRCLEKIFGLEDGIGFRDIAVGKDMAQEYKTLKFWNDSLGLRHKDRSITALAVEGWHVIGESIEAGHIKGGNACCLASICLPMGFLSGRTSGSIIVSLARERRAASPKRAATTTRTGPHTESINAAHRHVGRSLGARLGFVLGRLARKLRR
jgi:hypothetical protein